MLADDSSWGSPSPLAARSALRAGKGAAAAAAAAAAPGATAPAAPAPAPAPAPPARPRSALEAALSARVSALGAGAALAALVFAMIGIATRPAAGGGGSGGGGGGGGGPPPAPAPLWQRWWPATPHEEGASWTYDDHGADWPELARADGAPRYPACGGAAQSPVDLPPFPAAPPRAPLAFAYPAGAAWAVAARPAGHAGFEVALDGGAGPFAAPQPPAENFTVSGAGFSASLSQFHFHAPSEHSVAGARWPLEAHFVHDAGGGRLVVVGLLYNVSDAHNDVFDSFFWEMHRSQGNVTGVRVADMLAQAGPAYWRYEGSLTTPPCSEVVTWIVLPSTVGVSPLQMLAYEFALAGVDNHRATQPLGERQPVAGAR